MNTRFEYQYRDGSNYKSWGEVIFAGRPTDELSRRLMRSLDGWELFIADQVRVPEVFFRHRGLYVDDHCWHELVEISETPFPPTDILGRTFENFVHEMEMASATGWRVFDRFDREPTIKQRWQPASA